MAQQRIKLSVIEVKDPQEIGDKGAKKLVFKARNPEGKELQYFTFNQKLFPHIMKDTELDADVDTSNREYNGETYTDRKIVQVYVGNEPVTGKPGGGWKGKSPEELENERYRNRSIEAQTCLKEAVVYIGEADASKEQVVEVARYFLSFLDEAHGSQPAAAATTQDISKPESEKRKAGKQPDPEKKTTGYIDLGWLQEQLKVLQSNKLVNWTNVAVIKKLNAVTGQDHKKVSDAAMALSKEQAEQFTKEVNDMLALV